MHSDDDIFSGFTARALSRAAAVGRWVGRYWFRFEIHGLQNIPDGPCLVVGNHSGFGFAEELLFATTWHDEFPKRRAWGLIHDLFFDMPILGRYYRAIGAIPAAAEHARAAFDRGDVVLVFPGGDLDCCRPFYESRRVNFGDRRGYVRLAQQAGVPVIPLATVGSHWTWTFLPGGRSLAKIRWIRRLFRTDCVPLPTAVFAVLLASFVAVTGLDPWWTVAVVALLGLIPTPVKITAELGPPIEVGGRSEESAHEAVWGWLQERVASHDPGLIPASSR